MEKTDFLTRRWKRLVNAAVLHHMAAGTVLLARLCCRRSTRSTSAGQPRLLTRGPSGTRTIDRSRFQSREHGEWKQYAERNRNAINRWKEDGNQGWLTENTAGGCLALKFPLYSVTARVWLHFSNMLSKPIHLHSLSLFSRTFYHIFWYVS